MQTMMISEILIEDALIEADPTLEDEPEAYTRALAALLRPALEGVIAAFRAGADPGTINCEIAEQHRHVRGCRTAKRAFERFVSAMAE